MVGSLTRRNRSASRLVYAGPGEKLLKVLLADHAGAIRRHDIDGKIVAQDKAVRRGVIQLAPVRQPTFIQKQLRWRTEKVEIGELNAQSLSNSLTGR